MTTALPPNIGPALTGLARQTIADALAGRARPDPSALWSGGVAPDEAAEWLARPGAAFVTLTQGGELRGCIGSLVAHQPLREDVRQNALAAAFEDRRFPPLATEELIRTRIEVSVLSPPERLEFSDHADLVGRLRPGVDGLILQAGGRRGTFLPQVWDQLPAPERFLAHLVRKAGLPEGYWSEQVRIWRYTVTSFEEAPP